PSTWETWGLIVNEALASGVPCVATSGVPATRDLVTDGVTGFTVPVGDVDAMAARLRMRWTRRGEGHDFGPACRAHVDRCSFARAADGLAAALAAAVPGGRQAW